MSVNERIKQVRHRLKLSQINFSKGIYLSNGYYAEIELENRKANDRIIELISTTYGVNRQWLETGEGEMFDQKPDEKLEQMIITFRELNPNFKEFVLHFIDQLLKLQKKSAGDEKPELPVPGFEPEERP
jgi:transcriptional regulator with XRE-family HTH domain